jgi:hypothetical protein
MIAPIFSIQHLFLISDFSTADIPPPYRPYPLLYRIALLYGKVKRNTII